MQPDPPLTPGDFVGPPRDVVILAAPSVSALEVSGPAEAFRMAAIKLKEAGRRRSRPYALHLLSADESKSLGSTGGLTFNVECSFRDYSGPVDTLLVVGGLDVWTGNPKSGLLQWLRAACARSNRFGSVCTGAFVLAAAGLLDQQRVTTHWFYCERLAREYPAVTVDPEPIFIRNEKLWTAAGVTSGIDLALAMIEEDLGLEISLRIARSLVLYVRRPAWQSQFSSALALQAPTRLNFRELPFWILENLGRGLSLEDLAARVSMSPRNFSRTFTKEFGLPPLKFVAQLRTEVALRLLVDSDRSREEIALECGFGSVDAMERALARNRVPANSGK